MHFLRFFKNTNIYIYHTAICAKRKAESVMFCLHMGLMTEENVKNKSAGKFLRLMNALARWKMLQHQLQQQHRAAAQRSHFGQAGSAIGEKHAHSQRGHASDG